ncbi:hypothetical protein BDN72DRAFT_958136 [Pluteus cervinus]|uniref:Uncharacterized protein n=1 Tax=Pluteus cervinus TaxID=181527 RepID=A0ACD3B145_9AGAR|nr:hypothetical protein BDN72DRAFT_958136 [Pluteus cervinus]
MDLHAEPIELPCEGDSLLSYSVSRILSSTKNLFESLESWGSEGVFTSTINLKYSVLETSLALLVTILTMSEIDPPMKNFEEDFETTLKMWLAGNPDNMGAYLPELRSLATSLLLGILESLRQYYSALAESPPTLSSVEGAVLSRRRLIRHEAEILNLCRELRDDSDEDTHTPLGSPTSRSLADLRSATPSPPPVEVAQTYLGTKGPLQITATTDAVERGPIPGSSRLSGYYIADMGSRASTVSPVDDLVFWRPTPALYALPPIVHKPKELPYHYIGILPKA